MLNKLVTIGCVLLMLLTLDSCQESEIDFLSTKNKKEYSSVNSVLPPNKVSLEDVTALLNGHILKIQKITQN